MYIKYNIVCQDEGYCAWELFTKMYIFIVLTEANFFSI